MCIVYFGCASDIKQSPFQNTLTTKKRNKRNKIIKKNIEFIESSFRWYCECDEHWTVLNELTSHWIYIMRSNHFLIRLIISICFLLLFFSLKIIPFSHYFFITLFTFTGMQTSIQKSTMELQHRWRWHCLRTSYRTR